MISARLSICLAALGLVAPGIIHSPGEYSFIALANLSSSRLVAWIKS
jgi:hypothetical protein